MKNIKKYSVIIVALLFITISCRDVLDQKAVDAFNEESILKTLI